VYPVRSLISLSGTSQRYPELCQGLEILKESITSYRAEGENSHDSPSESTLRCLVCDIDVMRVHSETHNGRNGVLGTILVEEVSCLWYIGSTRSNMYGLPLFSPPKDSTRQSPSLRIISHLTNLRSFLTISFQAIYVRSTSYVQRCT
jgi:hypothetical protein